MAEVAISALLSVASTGFDSVSTVGICSKAVAAGFNCGLILGCTSSALTGEARGERISPVRGAPREQ